MPIPYQAPDRELVVIPNDIAAFQSRLHVVASVTFGKEGGPHARLVCGELCPSDCPATLGHVPFSELRYS